VAYDARAKLCKELAVLVALDVKYILIEGTVEVYLFH
jgi:hypothetical protein